MTRTTTTYVVLISMLVLWRGHSVVAQTLTQLTSYVNGDISSSPKELTKYQDRIAMVTADKIIYLLDPTNKEIEPLINGATGNPLKKSFYFNSKISPVVYNDRLYVTAMDDDQGPGLYSYSNGEAHLVAEIQMSDFQSINTRGTGVVHDGKLHVLISPDPSVGLEFYTIDQSENVELVEDLTPGPGGSTISEMISYQDRLVFSFSKSAYGIELWTFPPGQKATLLSDIYPGASSSKPQEFTISGEILYFTANDPVNKEELWRYDGNQVRLAADLRLNARPGSERPTNLTPLEDKLYCTTSGDIFEYDPEADTASYIFDVDHNVGLEVTMQKLYFTAYDDKLYEYNPSTRVVTALDSVGNIQKMAASRTSIIMFMTDDRIYASDGSIGSVTEVIPPTFLFYGSVINPYVIDDIIYFTAGDNTIGRELWQIDGSNTCSLVKNIERRSEGVQSGVVWDDQYMYFAYDSVLWRSDGTASGTQEWMNLGADRYRVRPVTVRDEFLYVIAENDIFQSTDKSSVLIKIDKITGSQTVIDSFNYRWAIPKTNSLSDRFYITTSREVLEIYDNSSVVTQFDTLLQSNPQGEYYVWEDDLYHTAYSGPTRGHLHKNGVSITDFGYSNETKGNPSGFMPHQGRLFFLVDTGNGKDIIWSTDGTEQDTKLVSDEFEGFATPIASLADHLYYRVTLPGQTVLLVTDGTSTGTDIVSTDITMSTAGVLGDKMLFSHELDPSLGAELYALDENTIENPTLIKDINPGAGQSGFSVFKEYDDFVLFTANDGVHGSELWITDGTESGTMMIEDIYQGISSSEVSIEGEFRGAPILEAINVQSTRELYILTPCQGEVTIDCPSESCKLASSVITSSKGVSIINANINDVTHLTISGRDGLVVEELLEVTVGGTLSVTADGCN